MDNYFELRITINPEIEDIVSNICFSNFACEGVVMAEEAYKDLEMTSTTRGTLRVFLTDIQENPVEILKTERELLKERGFSDEELGSWEICIDEKENQDWSKKWKEKWTVTHVTDRVAIVPSWLEYIPKENEITITLDPGCAFGTGTHQTTQLCMVALEKYMKPNSKVADIGTGSGILAIYAKKLGASYVYGCDNDETVIDVCKENAIKNGLCVDPLQEGGSKSPISGWEPSFTHKYTDIAKTNAKKLRNNATKQERILWQYLRKSQLGYKFRRQQPIGYYIADFFCPELKLIIELDGGQHNDNKIIEYDKKRDKFLQEQGFSVLRIWNNDIDKNIEGTIEYIRQQISNITPPPNPLPQGAGELSAVFPNPISQEAGEQANTYPPLEGGSKSPISGWGNSEVTFELNTADKLTEKYDFVCANILHNILFEIMGDLKNIMKDDAIMSLSGILNEKKQVVLDAIERENLKIIDTITQDQWISYVVTK